MRTILDQIDEYITRKLMDGEKPPFTYFLDETEKKTFENEIFSPSTMSYNDPKYTPKHGIDDPTITNRAGIIGTYRGNVHIYEKYHNQVGRT